VTAVVDTELLELDQDRFNQLMLKVPALSANLGRTLVQRLRVEMTRRRRRERPIVVGLVNTSARTQGLIGHVVSALVAKGESTEVLTDRTDADWPRSPGCLVERLPTGLSADERARLVRERIHQV